MATSGAPAHPSPARRWRRFAEPRPGRSPPARRPRVDRRRNGAGGAARTPTAPSPPSPALMGTARTAPRPAAPAAHCPGARPLLPFPSSSSSSSCPGAAALPGAPGAHGAPQGPAAPRCGSRQTLGSPRAPVRARCRHPRSADAGRKVRQVPPFVSAGDKRDFSLPPPRGRLPRGERKRGKKEEKKSRRRAGKTAPGARPRRPTGRTAGESGAPPELSRGRGSNEPAAPEPCTGRAAKGARKTRRHRSDCARGGEELQGHGERSAEGSVFAWPYNAACGGRRLLVPCFWPEQKCKRS